MSKRITNRKRADAVLQVLSRQATELLAQEGITPELLDMVDLQIAFTPVIAIRGEQMGQSVEAIPTMGGGYIVRHPLVTGTVTADELKIMRARYLLERDRRAAPWMRHLMSRHL